MSTLPNLITIIGGTIFCKIARRRLLKSKTIHCQSHKYSKNNKTLKLDLYRPNSAQNPPLIIWIHGGGWVTGGKTIIAPEILSQLNQGYALASLSYSFSQQAKWPQQIHDIEEAIKWLQQNANLYGFDADKLVLTGISAGGHLASFIGNNLGKEKCAAIVSISAPTDLAKLAKQNYAIRKIVTLLAGKSERVLQKASPIEYVSKSSPPHFLLHGTRDAVVDVTQSDAFYQRLIEHNIQCTYLKGEGFGHGDWRFSRQEYVQNLKVFLEKHVT